LHSLRRLVLHLLQSIRCVPACRWMSSHLCVLASKQAVWADKFNVKRVVDALLPLVIQRMDMAQLGKGMMHPTVKAQVAPWKLPCWPQPGRVRRELQRSWRQWAAKHRLPPRVHHRVQGCLASQVDLLQLQPPPPCWQQAEDEIHHVMAESEVLTWDDQDSTKAWALKRAEAGVHIINSMLLDVDTWVYTPGITPQTVLYLYSARAQAGLPDFLVRRRQPHRQPSPPTLFPVVKSKCYADCGHWKCRRRLHSCWRRIISMARIPYAREWKLIGRALRAVV